MPQILQAETVEQIAAAHALFVEYGRSLDFQLCFQSFDRELASLPGDYAPPAGRLLLAQDGETFAACAALRPLDAGTCEMKRVYVRPTHRGRGLGRKLVERILDEARALGYERMRLDTVPAMHEAQRLYEALGFVDVPPYTTNPVPGARFMELDLRTRAVR